jgi:hypothetical protein
MQLEKCNVVLRPRSNWEAIDLGFCLIQYWSWPFYRIWLAVTLPIILIISSIIYLLNLPSEYSLLIIWWLKPLFDRVALYFLSLALFNEPPTLTQTIFFTTKLILNKDLWLSLTLYRFALTRSLVLPVKQLEHAKNLATRIKLIKSNTYSAATWLTIICLHFELLILLAFYMLLFTFLPEHVQWDYIFYLDDELEIFLWLDILFYYLALSLLEPIYVAAGFALYLNRRTHLEGWDIELIFKAMRKKFEHLAILMALMLTMILASPILLAQQPAELAPVYIEQILAQEEFNTTAERKYWQYRYGQNNDAVIKNDWQLPNIWVNFAAELIEILIWLVIIGLLLWVIIKIQSSAWFKEFLTPHTSLMPDLSPPTKLERQIIPTLPTDLAQEFWLLVQQGQQSAALSLLYRASLEKLNTNYKFSISPAYTEMDCMYLLQTKPQPNQINAYIQQLINAWQLVAYGGGRLELTDIQQLFDNFKQI